MRHPLHDLAHFTICVTVGSLVGLAAMLALAWLLDKVWP